MKGIEAFQMVECPCYQLDTEEKVVGWALYNDGVIQSVQPFVIRDGKVTIVFDSRINPRENPSV